MDWMPFMIPITFILGGFGVGIVAMIVKSREKEHQHRERMFFAEKGMEIPPELFETAEEKKPSDFRGFRAALMTLGCITFLVGIGVFITLTIRDGLHDGINGVIPLFVGIGLLGAERLVTVFIVKPGRKE